MRTDVLQQEEGGVSGIPLGMIFSVHLLTYSSWPEFASKVNYAISQGTGMGEKKGFKSTGLKEKDVSGSIYHEEKGRTQEKNGFCSNLGCNWSPGYMLISCVASSKNSDITVIHMFKNIF